MNLLKNYYKPSHMKTRVMLLASLTLSTRDRRVFETEREPVHSRLYNAGAGGGVSGNAQETGLRADPTSLFITYLAPRPLRRDARSILA